MKTIARTLALLLALAALICLPPLAIRIWAPYQFIPWGVVWFGTLAFFLAANYFVPFKKVAREIIVRAHRRTKLWTAIIIASLLAASNVSARPDGDDTDHESELIAIGLCVLGVGAVVAWGIWKMCQRIPCPPAETIPPPPTNYPPVNINPTRTNRPTLKMPKMETSAANANGSTRSIAQFHMADPIGGGEFHSYYFIRVETTENLAQWRESLTVTGYVSDAGQYVGFWSNGACVYNAYLTPDYTGTIPIEQGTGLEPSKFFRAVVP